LPLALALAERIDAVPETGADPDMLQDAAAELRRLHDENENLRGALQALLDDREFCSCPPDDLYCPRNRAIAALQGEKK
jgi:regulator of sirC expression with transglutaminase-like and TPR domain